MKRKGILSGLICLALVVVSGVILVGYASEISEIQKDIEEMQAQLQENTMKWQTLNNRNQAMDLDELEDSVKSALEKGKKVADIQNSIMKADSADKKQDLRNSLKEFIADDESGSLSWYMADGKWELASDAEIQDDDVSVIWLNYSDDGNLNAYAKAYFLKENGTFYHVEKGVTRNGSAHYEAS